jgi:tetratricopeptide (TPR) repeat protein
MADQSMPTQDNETTQTKQELKELRYQVLPKDDLPVRAEFVELDKMLNTYFRVVITGQAGSGKSQLAKQYVHAKSNYYNCICWIFCDSPIEPQIAELVTAIPNQNPISRVYSILESSGPSLIVWDNALPHHLTEYIPEKSNKLVHTLITSQSNKWNRCLHVKLDDFSETFAREYLEQKLEQTSDGAELLAILEYHPFSVSLALNYIQQTGCSIKDYLSEFQIQMKELDDTDLLKAITGISLRYIQMQFPLAWRILQACVGLDPNWIVVEYLNKYFNESISNSDFELLRNFGLIQYLNQQPTSVIQIHSSVVKNLDSDFWKNEERENHFTHQIEELTNAFGARNSAYPIKHLIRHTKALLEICPNINPTIELNLAHLENLSLKAYISLVNFHLENCVNGLYRVLTRYQNLLGYDHPRVSGVLESLGSVYQSIRKYSEAKDFLEEALSIRERRYGAIHQSLENLLSALGSLALDQAQYDSALEYFKRALIIVEWQHGLEYSGIITIASGIGLIYRMTNENQLAVKFLKRAVEIQEMQSESDHRLLIVNYSNIALALCQLDNEAEATEYLLKTIKLHDDIFGAENVKVIPILLKLGECYLHIEKPKESAEILERALRIGETQSGTSDADLVLTLSALGETYLSLNLIDKAFSLFIRAKGIQENLSSNAGFGLIFYHMGCACLKQNLFEEAVEYLERAVRIQECYSCFDKREVASAYSKLGLAHDLLGNLIDAKVSTEKALRLLETRLGPNHLEVCTLLEKLGLLHYNLENYDQASFLLERAVQIAEFHLAKNHPRVANLLLNFASAVFAMKNWQEARLAFSRLLLILYSSEVPKPLEIARVLINLGKIHKELGLLVEANDFFSKALVLTEKSLGSSHSQVVAIRKLFWHKKSIPELAVHLVVREVLQYFVPTLAYLYDQ